MVLVGTTGRVFAQQSPAPQPTPQQTPAPQPTPQQTPAPQPTPEPRPAEPRGDTLPPPSPPPKPVQIACDGCARGDQLLSTMGTTGNMLRHYASHIVSELTAVRVDPSGSYNGEQEARLRKLVVSYTGELRDVFLDLDDRTDDELRDIGFALCKSPDEECAKYVGSGLKALRELAPTTFATPTEQRMPYGLPPEPPHTCDPYVGHVRSPKAGVGFDYGTGWQDSAKPVDGRAWSIGIEGRRRINNRLGVLARVERSTGRDESIDDDGDGIDDHSSGSVTRWMGMLGGSLRFGALEKHDLAGNWYVDGLVGLSRDGDRSGVMTAMDLSYQVAVMKVGLRVMQGLDDAREERAALLHAGFMIGAGPTFSYGAGCDFVERNAGNGHAWALALFVPLSGWAKDVGYVTPSVGVEGVWHGSRPIDVVLHGDLLVMPSGDRERALHQALLAGARVDLPVAGHNLRKTITVAALAGYDHVATTSSAQVQSGPVLDSSVGYGLQASDGAIYWKLHARFGVGAENEAYRALFVSFGMELRLHRSRWRDRD